MISFQVERWGDVVDEMRPLWSLHWSEVSTDHDVVPLQINEPVYRAHDSAGTLLLVTMRVDGKLVGYHTTFLAPHLHSASTLYGFTDLYFILPEWRRGWLPVKLFRYVEDRLREAGVVKVTTATEEVLERGAIFRRLKYKKTETVYTKVL
jgi:GNAT superfamily N-acetyltransferase